LRIDAKRIGRARAWEAEIASVPEFTGSDLRILWPVAADLEAAAERLYDVSSRRIGAPPCARCRGGVSPLRLQRLSPGRYRLVGDVANMPGRSLA
jgi:hypothetical protein